VVVLLVFNLLNLIQSKLFKRKEDSSFFTTRAIENYYQEQELLKTISIEQYNKENSKYFTVSYLSSSNEAKDTLMVQLLQTEIQKFDNGF
jgi:formate-dependent nitrite reductase cytochrome c552 subunit